MIKLDSNSLLLITFNPNIGPVKKIGEINGEELTFSII